MSSNQAFVIILALIVVGIPVVLGMGSEVLKAWLKHREKMAGALNAQAAERAAQYAAHTERLEQRMRVLERIATDKGASLSDEIDRLRDERPTSSAPLN